MTVNPINTKTRRENRGSLAAKLILLGLSLGLSLAIAEIVLRAEHTGKTRTGHHRLFCEYHPVLGWQKKPNFTGLHVGPKAVYQVQETMNSRGLRGPEYSYQKPEGEYRIVVLGDSFAEGYTVDFEDLFSEVLDRRLNQNGRRAVEIINAGTGGYSTDQELLWFTTEGVKYSPDLVVLVFCENDILFNTVDRYWRGFKPRFLLVQDQLDVTNIPVPLPIPEEGIGVAAPDRSVSLWMYETFALYRRLRDALANNETLASRFPGLRVNKPREGLPAFNRLFEWNQATGEEQREGLKVTGALLGQLKTEVERSGAQLLVLLVPTLTAPDAILTVGEICRERAIDCINPTEQFLKEYHRLKPQGKYLTFAPHDDHWSEEGHRLVAEILHEHIERAVE